MKKYTITSIFYSKLQKVHYFFEYCAVWFLPVLDNDIDMVVRGILKCYRGIRKLRL